MPYKLLPPGDPSLRAGIRILELRHAAGLSQRDLAQHLRALGEVRYGKAPRIVGLERGQALLTNEQAARFAEALGCTVGDIMADTDDQELERLRAELADIVAEGRRQRRQLRALEDRLAQGNLTKTERKRYDEAAVAVTWAKSQAALYRSRINQLQDDEL